MLIIVALFTFVALSGMWTVAATGEPYPLCEIITQRGRYQFIGTCQACLAAAAAFAALDFNSIEEWLSLGLFGFFVVLGCGLAFASPIFTVLAVMSVYRHPAEIAFRRAGWYYTTEAVRCQKSQSLPGINIVGSITAN